MSQQDEDDSPSHERWLVSYADFITLMFAFFTVLYATSNRDAEKAEQFQESVKRFLVRAGAMSGGSGEKINEGDRHTSPIESPIPTYNAASPLTKDVQDDAEEFISAQLKPDERKKLVAEVMSDALGVRLILAGDGLFVGNSVLFQERALPSLNKVADLIQRVGRRVLIEGHYSGPINRAAGFPSEWELSAARATALVRFFVKVRKLSPTEFVPIAFGEQRPWPGNAEKDRLRSRIEIVFLTEDVAL